VGGYTIIEVLIVLAVTSLLFTAVIATFSGKQAKSQATQSARDMETQLQSVSSDVHTGSFPNGVECSVSGAGGPTIAENPDVAQGGSNAGCIFLGKVVVFDEDNLKVYPVVGRQYSTGKIDVSSLAQALPLIINVNDVEVINYNYQYGTTIKKVEKITGGSMGQNLKAIAYFHQLSGGALTSNAETGSRAVDLYGITFDGGGGFQPISTPINLSAANLTPSRYLPVDEGVRICTEAGNGEKGELILGGTGGSASTYLNWGQVAEEHCNG